MSQNLILSLIVVSYFLLLLFIALYTSRNSNNESFFVGNRSSKWWLVAFGMIGTSLSGMTFISVPGTVGTSAFSYFQVVIGYWIGYFLVAFVLLPIYYRMQLTSIYTYLDRRLGKNAHKTGSMFFLLSRTVGATLRLYLVIKVLEIFILDDLNISFEVTAVLILTLILLYTYRGGVKTIVWTDTLQTTFMLLGLIVCIFYLSSELGLHLGEAWTSIADQGMTKVFNTDLNDGGFFLKQIIGGAFITISMTGLDQEMMQKNISVSNLKDSQKNMMVMGTLQMVVVFIFLFLGGILVLFAQENGITATGDDLFPAIAINSGLPFVITIFFVIGLISALFPSADGALTALTSSFCIDILNMQERKEWNERRKVNIRLAVHYAFAVLFLAFVFFFREVDNGSLIIILLKLAGYTYGPLLGLFAFGILTQRAVSGNWPIVMCLFALSATLLIDVVNNYEWYVPKFHLGDEVAGFLSAASKAVFGGYKIGIELLIVNAALTFLFLFLVSKKNGLNRKTLS